MSSSVRRPPADSERHKAFARSALHHVAHYGAVVAGSRDVEKHELVRALALIGFRLLDGVAGIYEIDEVNAFDNAPVAHVEARDYSYAQHFSEWEAKVEFEPFRRA